MGEARAKTAEFPVFIEFRVKLFFKSDHKWWRYCQKIRCNGGPRDKKIAVMHHNSSQWQTYKCVGSGLWKFRIFLQTIGTDGKDTFRGVSLGGLGTPDSAYQVPQIREHKTPKTLGSRNSIQFIHTARRRKTR